MTQTGFRKQVHIPELETSTSLVVWSGGYSFRQNLFHWEPGAVFRRWPEIPLLEEEANRSFDASNLPVCRGQDAGELGLLGGFQRLGMVVSQDQIHFLAGGLDRVTHQTGPVDL